MSKDAMMVGKLKECLQEAVVFLRTLGDFKIPAVVERRRKELLNKLVEAQGDTLRERPSKFEEDPPEKPKPVAQKVVKEKDEPSSDSSSTVTSPSRRDSAAVNSLVKDYEVIHKTAKKQQQEETPKPKWQVELKKTRKPADFPSQGDSAKENTPEPKDEPPVVELRNNSLESNELIPDRPSSTVSLDSNESNEPEAGTPKHKKKGASKLGGLFKKRGRDKSPAPSRKELSPTPCDVDSVDGDKVECEESVEVEEGVVVSGKLEYKTKTKFSTKFVSKDVKLKETTLHIGDKDSVSMLGCTVTGTDGGFDLFSHSTQKHYVFKVTDGGDEAKEKWTTALKTAIEECTPKEEPSAEPVPTINVVEPVTSALTETNDQKKKRRESKGLEAKPQKLLPKQDEINGYIHRKKPGIGARWEKTFCKVTYTALYFTMIEDNSEYEHMLQVTTDGSAAISEKGKGHDKNSKVIAIKMGKKVEQLSVDKKDYESWLEVIQRVFGVGGGLELDSEEENIEEELDGPDDLYEEVISAPPVPNSPRPGRPAVPTIPPEDDLLIDEDIYEDTDSIMPGEYMAPVVSTTPQLPDRNPPMRDTTPQPKLPPRNPVAAQPQLPPRNSGPTLPARGDKPKLTAPIPTTSVEDEELYDDVVVQEDVDENYDDVVIGDTEIDDTYDDVVAGQEPITEEFYEDMVAGELPQEDYVVMEQGAEDGDELYVDVDHEPSPSPQIAKPPTPKPAASPKSKTSTFARVFPGKGKAHQVAHSGSISYRAPKKTKFEEKHGVVEDTSLLIYKTSSDKKHQDKIALSDCALELGSTEAGAGQYAFKITKGSKPYHFSFKTQDQMDPWVEVLKKLVKYAPVDLGEQQVYQASQDHIAESDDQITFKKGSFIRLISQESDLLWFGQLGNEAQVFDGKTGKFPADKVILAEDLYI